MFPKPLSVPRMAVLGACIVPNVCLFLFFEVLQGISCIQLAPIKQSMNLEAKQICAHINYTLFNFPNAAIKSAHSDVYSKFFKALSTAATYIRYFESFINSYSSIAIELIFQIL